MERAFHFSQLPRGPTERGGGLLVASITIAGTTKPAIRKHLYYMERTRRLSVSMKGFVLVRSTYLLTHAGTG